MRLGLRLLWTAGAIPRGLGDRPGLGPTVNPYIYRISVLCGLNAILALSLNLVNGITGQFSIGHAGFMAVGAYTSAAFTVYAVPRLFGVETGEGGLAAAGPFLLAILVGGAVSAAADSWWVFPRCGSAATTWRS